MADAERSRKVEFAEAEKKATSTRRRSKTFEAIQMKRCIAVYHITEGELHNISTGNVVSRWAAATGWSFVSFALATALNLCMQTEVSELGKRLAWFIIPACAALAVVCFGVWMFTRRKICGDLERIKSSPEDEEI